jgi:hypothetical protein
MGKTFLSLTLHTNLSFALDLYIGKQTFRKGKGIIMMVCEDSVQLLIQCPGNYLQTEAPLSQAPETLCLHLC